MTCTVPPESMLKSCDFLLRARTIKVEASEGVEPVELPNFCCKIMSDPFPVFKPFPLLSGCHQQTIGAFLIFHRRPFSITRFVHLSDGEKISMEVTTPPQWKPHQTTVVMVHGLLGSHKSSYVVRLARKLYQKGIRSVCVNLRGCGSGKGYAWQLYRAESSDDVWQALKEIKRDTPHSPLVLIGFSLGGNIVLKMGGERGREALTIVDKIIAINPPIDMYSSMLLLSQNKLYERIVMYALRSDVEYCHDVFEDLSPIEIPHSMTLLEFNEYYVPLHAGFSNAKDYYYACSAGRLLPSIRTPSYMLFSKDDPIVDTSILDSIKYPDNIKVVVTEHGGHLGYLGSPRQKGGVFWLDFVLFRWIFDNRNDPLA